MTPPALDGLDMFKPPFAGVKPFPTRHPVPMIKCTNGHRPGIVLGHWAMVAQCQHESCALCTYSLNIMRPHFCLLSPILQNHKMRPNTTWQGIISCPTNRTALHRTIGQAAVDHNGLVPHRAQRPDATYAAPVELHAAADAVRPAAQHDDAGLLGYAMVVSWKITEFMARYSWGRCGFRLGSGCQPFLLSVHER